MRIYIDTLSKRERELSQAINLGYANLDAVTPEARPALADAINRLEKKLERLESGPGRGLNGFPSSFAALKYLGRTAAGPCSWKLNGSRTMQEFYPEFEASL